MCETKTNNTLNKLDSAQKCLEFTLSCSQKYCNLSNFEYKSWTKHYGQCAICYGKKEKLLTDKSTKRTGGGWLLKHQSAIDGSSNCDLGTQVFE